MVAVGFIDTVVESVISVNHRQSIAHLLSVNPDLHLPRYPYHQQCR
ncbi:hypothetical protein [Nostoc sp. DedQUE04]|nr:hypothetical protein [Nostoc sp. DedQUE04]